MQGLLASDAVSAWHNVLLNFTIGAPSWEQFFSDINKNYSWNLVVQFLVVLVHFVCILSQCLLQYPIHTYPDLLHTSAAEIKCTNACVLWKVCCCSDFSILLPYWTTKYQLTIKCFERASLVWVLLHLLIFKSTNSLYNIEKIFPNVCCEAYFLHTDLRRLPQIPVCWNLIVKLFS